MTDHFFPETRSDRVSFQVSEQGTLNSESYNPEPGKMTWNVKASVQKTRSNPEHHRGGSH